MGAGFGRSTAGPSTAPVRRVCTSGRRRRAGGFVVGGQGQSGGEEVEEPSHVLDLVGGDRAGLEGDRRQGPVAGLEPADLVEERAGAGLGGTADRPPHLVGVLADPAVLHPAAELVVDEHGQAVASPAVGEDDVDRLLAAEDVPEAPAPLDGGRADGPSPGRLLDPRGGEVVRDGGDVLAEVVVGEHGERAQHGQTPGGPQPVGVGHDLGEQQA